LQAPETAFLVVAAPEPDAIREAGFFAGRLATERMPLHGLVLNRVHTVEATELPAKESLAAADALEAGGDNQTTADALRVHARLAQQVAREAAVTARFTAEHPRVPVAAVAAQPADVHDIDGLREIGAALAVG
jgi:anion-transporting  ArsA/GET3 family ATPase